VNDVTLFNKCVTPLKRKVLTFVQLPNTKKITTMGNLLYIIAVVLLICWAIGFFAYSAGGIIHLLLVIAIISILLRVIQGRKPL
jgi:hypothetical protein